MIKLVDQFNFKNDIFTYESNQNVSKSIRKNENCLQDVLLIIRFYLDLIHISDVPQRCERLFVDFWPLNVNVVYPGFPRP